MEVYYQQVHYNKITNRPCEAVGVEETNGSWRDSQMLLVQMPKGAWSETLQIHNRINDWIANL